MRHFVALVSAVAVALTAAPVVFAAAPGNDNVASAAVLTTFPFVDTVDMTEATVEPTDPWCDSVTGTVWYRYVATAEQELTVSVPAGESDTRVCVLPDSLTAGTYYFIQPSEIRSITLDAGRTYYIELAVTNNAPTATLDLAVGPAFFDMTISVDSTGVADRVSGAAVIRGTIACSVTGTVDLFIRVVERAGAKRVADNFSEQVHIAACGPTATTWQLRARSLVAYVPGSASVRIDAYGSGSNGWGDYDLVSTTVLLRAH